MKVSDKYLLKDLNEEKVLIPIGQTAIDMSSVVTLNDTAFFIYKAVQVGLDKNQIVEKMIQEYEIDAKTAEEDLVELINNFTKLGIIE